MSDPVRELAEKATPGPWFAEIDRSTLGEVPVICDGDGFTVVHDRGLAVVNAELIALAPDLARVAADLAEELRTFRVAAFSPALLAYERLQDRAKQ